MKTLQIILLIFFGAIILNLIFNSPKIKIESPTIEKPQTIKNPKDITFTIFKDGSVTGLSCTIYADKKVFNEISGIWEKQTSCKNETDFIEVRRGDGVSFNIKGTFKKIIHIKGLNIDN